MQDNQRLLWHAQHQKLSVLPQRFYLSISVGQYFLGETGSSIDFPGRTDLKSLLSEMQSRYPRLFISGSPDEFLCEFGWLKLIDGLCDQINCLLSDDEAPLFHISQVKQKYGELRFYAHADPSVVNRTRILALMAEAKGKSLSICEICGATGRLEQWRPRSGFWQTLCDEHGALESTTSRQSNE